MLLTIDNADAIEMIANARVAYIATLQIYCGKWLTGLKIPTN